MKKIELKSTLLTYYTLDIPDEKYAEVRNLLGGPTYDTYGSGEVHTDLIKICPRPFRTSEYFAEELHSLCDCDVTDEDYTLVVEDMDTAEDE